jgi:hypothetical protein
MCVLCQKENLRLLVAPLSSLSHREVAESIAVAREAAWQLVLDTADAMSEEEGEPVNATVELDGYLDYVVDRAERDSAVPAAELGFWTDGLNESSLLKDPRVQAFLSSAAEGLASYILQIREHQAALELFLEERNGAITFAGVGVSGEIIFDRGTERFVVLNDEEALRIAMDRMATGLCKEDPRWLLEYTNLPVGAADVLAAMQQGPADRANDILAGIVDLHALTEDRVRQVGYAPFIAEGTDDFTEQRFGDRVIIRLRGTAGTPPE